MLTLDNKPNVVVKPVPFAPGVLPHRRPQPLKHQRYAGSEVRSLTIAAGFRCLDGILIGADSRLEDDQVKFDGNKTFSLPSRRSDFQVIMTGCGDFNAIQTCAYLLDEDYLHNCEGTLAAISRSLREFRSHQEFDNLVASNPSATDLLFGVRSSDGETDLIHVYGNKF